MKTSWLLAYRWYEVVSRVPGKGIPAKEPALWGTPLYKRGAQAYTVSYGQVRSEDGLSARQGGSFRGARRQRGAA